MCLTVPSSHRVSITFLQNFSNTYNFLILKYISWSSNSSFLVESLTFLTRRSRQPGLLQYSSLNAFRLKLCRYARSITWNSDMYCDFTSLSSYTDMYYDSSSWYLSIASSNSLRKKHRRRSYSWNWFRKLSVRLMFWCSFYAPRPSFMESLRRRTTYDWRSLLSWAPILFFSTKMISTSLASSIKPSMLRIYYP